MRIDEPEELLEQDDIYVLFWVNQHVKKKDLAGFLPATSHFLVVVTWRPVNLIQVGHLLSDSVPPCP